MGNLLVNKYMPAPGNDERDRFDRSFAQAQLSGTSNDADDYLLDHVALYQHATEDDPRHAGIYFMAAPLEQILADPHLNAIVQDKVSKQPPSADAWKLDNPYDRSFAKPSLQGLKSLKP